MKRLLHKGLIISWALAIFYLHLGSLVNFHQHHLWKKYLIPTVIAGKKEKKEETAFVLKAKTSNSQANQFDPITKQFSGTSVSNSLSGIVVTWFSHHSSVPITELPRALSLRAPPQA